jgi:cysteinyl-tRNA synthetase
LTGFRRSREWPRRRKSARARSALAEARLAARRAKDWAEADRLRTQLKDAGWEMEDRADGYALKRR